MTTGIHNGTFENLQLNAGAFLRNFDHSDLATAAEVKAAIADLLESNDNDTLLGMTQGGGTFQCVPTMRNIEGDGLRAPHVGGTVNDGWSVKMTTTLKEITPRNFKDALISADIKTESSKTIITPRTIIKEEDYIPLMCWVGDTSLGLLLIELDNVLNTAGATLTFTDKGEGTIPMELQAHHANATNQEEAPCRVIFLKDPKPTNTTDQTQPAAAGDEPTA